MPSDLMRALVVERPGRFELREIPRPRPNPAEVLLRITHCGVCGTDLHIISGQFPVSRFPLVIGHEVAGEVVAVGADVPYLSAGRAVAVDPINPCRTCHFCRRGRTALCRNASELGIHVPGGLAEYVVAPGLSIYPLPSSVSSSAGALVEPVACAIRGQDRALIQLGDTVVVVGGGAQGLLHVLLARMRGAARVIVSARHRRRRERAIALGADIAIAPEAGHAVAEVLAATTGRGADVVIEASGSASGCTDAVRMLSVGGRLLVHGAPPAELHLPVSLRAIFEQELTVVGTFGGTDDTWPRAIDLISTGRLDPTALVDAEWPLRDTPTGVDELLRNRGLVKGQIRVSAE